MGIKFSLELHWPNFYPCHICIQCFLVNNLHTHLGLETATESMWTAFWDYREGTSQGFWIHLPCTRQERQWIYETLLRSQVFYTGLGILLYASACRTGVLERKMSKVLCKNLLKIVMAWSQMCSILVWMIDILHQEIDWICPDQKCGMKIRFDSCIF